VIDIDDQKILRVILSKKKLGLMPAEEREVFLYFGHILNEITIFTRLMYIFANTKSNDEQNQAGKSAGIIILALVLAGKLHESWMFITQKIFSNERLNRIIKDNLDDENQEVLKKIKKQFSSTNSITILRNFYGFHYGKDIKLASSIDDVNSDLLAYLYNKDASNNLYFYSELIVQNSMLRSLKDAGFELSLIDLTGQLFETSADITMLGDSVLSILHNKILDVRQSNSTLIQLIKPKKLSQLELPWFTDTADIINK
jgi:hypothetical protein